MAIASCVIATLAGAVSCSRPAAPSLTREAFLTFDNLTGDASLDWIAQAAPRMLEHDLIGVPKTVPLAAATLRDAYLAGAVRLVHGYYEIRSGKLHFEIAVEDSANHRMIQTAAENGPVLEAMNRAAKSLDAGAHDFSAPADAAAAWAQGDYQRATMLDPNFALAWLAWMQQLLTARDTAGARDVAEHAMAQPNLGPPIDRARLDLAAATLREDQDEQIKASRNLAELIPYDPSLLGTLAELEMNARRFGDSARDYQAMSQTMSSADPARTPLLNSLGYAEALAGDLDAARKTFQEYGRGPGQAAVNSLDSLGEALFVNGKFDEADRQFQAAYEKDPRFLDGETLWKAAHARWLGGDLAGADTVAGRYLQDRAKARDPLLTWRRATWLYETGRQQQAKDLLAPEVSAFARQQLQVWSNPRLLPSDLAGLEQRYKRANPLSDGLVRTLYAEALDRAGRKAEARDLLKLWPLPEKDDSPLQSLVYPKFTALRKELE